MKEKLMEILSKNIVLKDYIPTGTPSVKNFNVREIPIKISKDKEVLVKNLWISVDPYMRTRMTDRKNYIPPFTLNEPMDGSAIGEVIETNSKIFSKGDLVYSFCGWRDYFVTNEENLEKIKPIDVPIQAYLGPLGFTGHTAYVGLFNIGNLQPEKTVLVSSAAGAVGSMVCQFAKIMGCKVIASTGTDEKVEWLKNELLVDHAFNYKKVENLVLYFKDKCPGGFDFYFDNVGGDFLESVIYRMRNFGKIVICGRISQMNATSPTGLKNMAHVLVKRLTIRGFLIFDHLKDRAKFEKDVSKWIKEGKLQWKETVVQGLENSPEAFANLLEGKNIGKMLIKI